MSCILAVVVNLFCTFSYIAHTVSIMVCHPTPAVANEWDRVISGIRDFLCLCLSVSTV